MDAVSGSFVIPRTLAFLRQGTGAPIWRAVTTPENAVTVNVISLVVIVLCLGYVVRQLGRDTAWEEDPLVREARAKKPWWRFRLTPFLAMLSAVCIPSVMSLVTQLTPLLSGLVPAFLSMAVVASLNSMEKPPETDDDDEDDEYCRDTRSCVGLRLFLAGALAAVGVWERSIGVFCAPLSLAMAWLPALRRERLVVSVSAPWMVGFLTAFPLEPLLVADCPWTALLPLKFPLSGLVVFVFICIVPIGIVRKFGENRWTLGGWTLVLLVFGLVTVLTGHFDRTSASERFVRRVLGELGARKYIVGDGRFDVMIDEYKPTGVRCLSATSVADKEFLVRLCDDGQAVSNKLLTVRQHYDFKDDLCRAALAETGLFVRKDEADGKTSARTANMPRKELTDKDRKRLAEARRKDFEEKARPLAESLNAMGEGYESLPEGRRAIETEKARANIRKAWKQGFSGTKMSNTLLNIDLRKADRKALEADAVEALVVDRNDPAANAVLGALRLEDGRLEDAEHYLRKGVKGGGVLAMGRLAMLLVNTNRSKEAEEWAQKAVKLMPRDWNARQALAAAFIENGKLDEASQELDTIRRHATTDGQLKQVEAFLAGARKRLSDCRRKSK